MMITMWQCVMIVEESRSGTAPLLGMVSLVVRD